MRRGGCLVDHPRSHLHVWSAVPRRIRYGPDAVQRTLVASRPPRSARRFAQPLSRERGRHRTKAIRQAARRRGHRRFGGSTRTIVIPTARIARLVPTARPARPVPNARPTRTVPTARIVRFVPTARTGLRNQPVHDAWTDPEQSGWRGQEPVEPASSGPDYPQYQRAAMAATTTAVDWKVRLSLRRAAAKS